MTLFFCSIRTTKMNEQLDQIINLNKINNSFAGNVTRDQLFFVKGHCFKHIGILHIWSSVCVSKIIRNFKNFIIFFFINLI